MQNCLGETSSAKSPAPVFSPKKQKTAFIPWIFSGSFFSKRVTNCFKIIFHVCYYVYTEIDWENRWFPDMNPPYWVSF